MNNILSDVVELLNGDGETLAGFAGDVVQAEAEAIVRFSGRPYCIVKDWIHIEIEVTDDYRNSLADDGLQPCVLYAANVMLHSANKRQVGDWVRSTFQRSLADGYVFETRNTTYILLGPGHRKKARIQTVMAITDLY